MSTAVNTTGKAEKAIWNDEETTALVNYLVAHKAEAGDGGNFKTVTFNAALPTLAPLRTSGPPKTAKMCKTKWAAIKATYHAIETYREQSGFSWDDANGAGIDLASASVWNEYLKVKSHAAMRPFRNNGWRHYDKIQAILPSHFARGGFACHVGESAAASVNGALTPGFLGAVDAPGTGNEGEDRDSGNGAVVGQEVSGGGDHGTAEGIIPGNGNEGDTRVSGGGLIRPGAGNQDHDESMEDLSQTAASSPPVSVGSKRKFSAVGQDVGSISSARASSLSISTGASSRKSKSSKNLAGVSAMVSSGFDHMDISISRLTDVFQKSLLAPDPSLSDQRQAVDAVQVRNDGLDVEQKVAVISHFARHPAAATIYLSLHDDEVRKSWLCRVAEGVAP